MIDRWTVMVVVLLVGTAARAVADEPAVELGWQGWYAPRHWTRLVVHPERIDAEGDDPLALVLPGGQVLRVPGDASGPIEMAVRVEVADPQVMLRGQGKPRPVPMLARPAPGDKLLVLRRPGATLWRDGPSSRHVIDVALPGSVWPSVPAADGTVTVYADNGQGGNEPVLVWLGLAAGDRKTAGQTPEGFVTRRDAPMTIGHRLWRHAVGQSAPGALRHGLVPPPKPVRGYMVRLLLWVIGWVVIGAVGVVVLPRTSGRLRNATGVVMLSVAYAALAMWYLPQWPPVRLREWTLREVTPDGHAAVVLRRVTVGPGQPAQVVLGTVPDRVVPSWQGQAGPDTNRLVVQWPDDPDEDEPVLEVPAGPDGGGFATVSAELLDMPMTVRTRGSDLVISLGDIPEGARGVIFWQGKTASFSKPSGSGEVILKDSALRRLVGFDDAWSDHFDGAELERAATLSKIAFAGGRLATRRPVAVVVHAPREHEKYFRLSSPDEIVYDPVWTILWGTDTPDDN